MPITSLMVANLTTAATYADSFKVEVYSDIGLTTLVGAGSCTAVANSTGTGFVQSNAIVISGLTYGATYYARAGVVAPVTGTVTWSAVYTVVMGTHGTPTGVTYTSTLTPGLNGITVTSTPANVPTDNDHFEAFWVTDGSTPSATVTPMWQGSRDGSGTLHLFAGGSAGQTVTVYLRAVNTAGQAQVWTSVGSSTVSATTTLALLHDGTSNSSQSRLNLKGSTSVSITDLGSGDIQFSIATPTPGFVQHVQSGNSSLPAGAFTQSVTVPSVTPRDCLIVMATSDGTAGPNSLGVSSGSGTDNQGDTPQAIYISTGFWPQINLWIIPNCNGGNTTVTITGTATSAAGFIELSVTEWTNVLTASVVDVSNVVNNVHSYSGSTFDFGPITTTNANDLLIAGIWGGGSFTPTAPTGWGTALPATAATGGTVAYFADPVSATGTYHAVVNGIGTAALVGFALALKSQTAGYVSTFNGQGGAVTGVSSVNSLTGALTIAGAGSNTVSTSGSTITVTGANVGGASVKTANYTAVSTDSGTLLVFNSASAVTLTLPATPPSATWNIEVQNIGAGTLTISPNGKQLDGSASSLSLAQNQGVYIATDNTNYFTERGIGGTGLTNPMTTAGDIIIGGTGGTPTRVPAGTAGQVLTMVSGAPAWAAATGGSGGGGGGSLIPIGQVTVTTAGPSVSFSSIPSSYTNLHLTVAARSAASGSLDSLTLAYNGDTTAAHYAGKYNSANTTSTPGAGSQSGTQPGAYVGNIPASATVASAAAAMSIDIMGYSGTTFLKSGIARGSAIDIGTTFASSNQEDLSLSHTWNSTAAINQITLTLTSGGNFVVGSTFTLWGVSATSTPPATGSGTALLGSWTASSSTEIDMTTRNATGQSGAAFQSDYDEYELHIVGFKVGTAGAAPLLQFSQDGGTTWDTANHYDWAHVNCTLTGTPSSGTNNQGGVNAIVIFADSNRVGLANSESPGMAATLRMYDPLSTTDYKFVTGQGLAKYNGNGSRYQFTMGGVYWQTPAVTAVRVIMTSGTIAAGRFRLYGVTH